MSHALQQLPWGLGVIEGFYGRCWSALDRLDTLGFLAGCGYRYYVYAPKSDAVLRRDWRTSWSAGMDVHLREIAARAHAAGLVWGVGLSPLGLVENPDASALRDLRAKLEQLDSIGVELLCLLFDDMPRQVEDLAARQSSVVAEVAAVTRARHLVVCPSYYTRDPVLERLFGTRPSRYWEEFASALPPEVGIFWTGEQVCSPSYDATDLAGIARKFGRAPVLWDNYPVNDGARMADFLHVDAFRNRPPELARLTSAHFVNPMNQCWLSRIPLLTLPRVYAEGSGYDAERAFADAARSVAGEAAAALLVADRALLQEQGLVALGDTGRSALAARYAGIDAGWAREIQSWLRGEYAFDPACLTG
jgi:hypothetical protein